MVKGFTRDGKFHPTTSSSGAKRKKRIESKDMLSPTGGVKLHLSKKTESIRLKRDHGIPQKRSGLNKVTIMEFTKRGKQYSPRLFQVNMNGVGAHFPANKALATEEALSDIESAKHADKRGHKIGT